MTRSNTSIAGYLMHDMHTTSRSVTGDVHKGTGENMDDKVTYRQQVTFCGKPRCRKCQQGTGHGPYWYSYQVVDGRTIRTYIGKNFPPGVQVPTSQTPPSTAGNHAITRLVNMRDARESLANEINELDHLLALNPSSEEVAQRLMIALSHSKRRGEALRVYQQLVTTLLGRYKREPSADTQVVYEAVLRGEEVVGGDEGNEARGVGQQSMKVERKVARTQQGLQIGRSNQSSLVGREHELHLLQQLLIGTEEFRQVRPEGQKKAQGTAAATLEMQHAQSMVLMGEGGIGKTRLAEEAAREAQRRGWAVSWSSIYAQESGIPYRFWTGVLRRMIIQDLWLEQDLDRHPHLFEPLKALLPEIDERMNWKSKERGEATGFYGYAEQVLLWEAVYELLTTISARTPLMIVLDDVQWADASSCELLGYLARRLQNHPLVLLMTCRENELVSNHPLRSLLAHMQREHAVETLHLKPLTAAQVGSLVAHLPQHIVQHIQIQAAGNPFFAEELAHSFRIDDAKSMENGGDMQQPPHEVLPGTVTAALHQRLNKLSPACQQLLSKAAVLGSPFGFDLLSVMEAGSSEADEDVLFDLLEEALRSGILTEEGTGTHITYHFWHPLLSAYLYNQLSSTRRARLHRRAAEALQQVYAAKHSEQAASITRHLVQGGADVAQVAYYAALAGNHAYGLSAYPEAERHYRLAVEQVEKIHAGQPYGEQERLRLAFMLERLAECMRIRGNFKEARNLFEHLLNVRAQLGALNSAEEAQQEAQIQALLYSEIGWTWRFTGETERTRECYERGEQVLRDAGILRGSAWARLRFQKSSLYWQQGNYEEALRAAHEALSLFEESIQLAPKVDLPDTSNLTRIRLTLLGDPVDLGRTHALLGALASAIGRRNEALEHQNRALAIYERYNRQREIAHVCNNIGYLHLKRTEYTLAQSFLHRSFSLAERIGDVPLMSVVFHNLGELAASSGDLQEAETLYKKSLLLAEQVEDREYISLWNSDLAGVLLAQEKLVDTEVCVGRALTTGRAIRNTPCLGLALVALGNLRIEQAKAEATRATRNLKRARGSLQHALNLPGLEVETRVRGQLALAEVFLLMGQREAARGEAARAMEQSHLFELVGVLKDCERLLGKVGG